MPGEVSRPHEEPICKCQHFKSVHVNGVCTCGCTKFEEIPFDSSELGRTVHLWLNRYKKPKHSKKNTFGKW